MKRPLLQIALDNSSLEDAFKTLKSGLDEVVDIIEVGTYLIMMEGIRAVSMIRSAYPDKKVVADAMVLAPQFGIKMLEQGPDFVTVASPSELDCIETMVGKARTMGAKCQIQLYGSRWGSEELEQWKHMGIEHIVFDRNGAGPWGDEEEKILQMLCGAGFQVAAAGGIKYEDLQMLSAFPLYTIICGKSVRNALNPAEEAKRIKNKCGQLWNTGL